MAIDVLKGDPGGVTLELIQPAVPAPEGRKDRA
jgi:hypothetical protein